MTTTRTSRQAPAQAGSVAVFVALSMIVLAGFATLAVDYGFLEYKRSRLQNAADAAALAGANVLVQYGSNQGAVIDTAIRYGQANLDDADGRDVAIRNSDVTFPDAVTVQSRVGRTTERGNPVDMFLGRILGWNTQDISASGKAALFCSKSSKCLKPWSPPAQFTWDDTCDGNKKYNNNGQLDAQSSCEMHSVEVQGYGNSDVGAQIVLKFGDPSGTVTPGHYQAVDYPALEHGNPVSGGDAYRDNIAGCTGSNDSVVRTGDTLQVEPGDMVGPTKQGLAALLAKDPDASWDGDTNSIVGSAYADALGSPRVALIPFYDPRYPQESGRNSLKVYQLGAVFIEGVAGSGDVTGRFVKSMAVDPVRQTGCDASAAYALYGAGLVR
ncbi:pilus assembly protein TadG-related protein [Solidesulfovibrio sp.]|uniref:pilus assembly protein TadG-related protein n=1 Tax=Solidesulfovibrio sp. TaxID=2910990 RepID=UPI002B21E38F|nr:pilus assembly protein TadG-related protein [Solidesulfovibrio sp.]MEA5088338.1 pilus assembly protein TadG-related protein [Solidesulfovibrio sp.]